MNNTLILTVGLPRSGKSTWAKHQQYPVVNRDDLRLAFHGKEYIQEVENMITILEETYVKYLLLQGHDKIILDNCHTKQKYIDKWIQLGYNIELKIFATPKEECIKRVSLDKQYLISVIENQYNTCDIEKLRFYWSVNKTYLEDPKNLGEIKIHSRHCCPIHGCKYNEDTCPVTNNIVTGVKCNECL